MYMQLAAGMGLSADCVRLGEATVIESHSAELLPAPWRQGRGTCNEKDKKCG